MTRKLIDDYSLFDYCSEINRKGLTADSRGKQMPLSDKKYYYLQEVIKRWGVALIDVRYFAEHGQLEVQTWLPETIMKIYRNKRTEDGEVVPIQVGVTNYKGYAIVEPDELRNVFHASPHSVLKFRSVANKDFLKIYDGHAKYMVSIEDLVVCKEERDRFESQFALPLDIQESAMNNRINPTPISFSGRPSVMHKIEQQLLVRSQSNALLPTLAAESRYLHAWAKENIAGEQIPTARTIGNAMRTKYKHAQYAPENSHASASA
jgi:hypothetical protein